MAEIAVNFLIDKLGPLLVQEVDLLRGVKQEIRDIKLELESISSFLKDADARAAAEELEGGESREGIKTWVKQVREEAYRIEDVVDEYRLEEAKLISHGPGLISRLRRFCSFIKQLKRHRGIVSEIRDIKSSLDKMQKRGERYGFSSNIGQGSSSRTRNVIPHDSRVGSLFLEDDEVVGIESARDKLIDLLVNGRSERSVIALVGEGGLGKTTLAGKIFNSDIVKRHFDCRVLITVGKEREKKNLLKSIMQEFQRVTRQSVSGDNCNMEEIGLITAIRELLNDKTYMIVLDDVWKIDFWGDVEHALFDNNKGSRIMLTTRRMTVANFCKMSSFVQVHELETLSPDDAWKLFCRKAFGPSSGGYCPSELKDLSYDILAKCRGLPLAIVAVGGLLSSKSKVVSEWQMLLDSLSSKLGSDPRLKDCNRVLSEGYYDLPHHLKSCFLYFGLFPEDYQIDCGRLLRLWIAEGFVHHNKWPTTEQVAEEFLSELIDRSLVQVVERHADGRAKICQVHDLMYEIIVRKTRELGFCGFLNEIDLSNCSRTRRLSVHRSSNDILERIKESKIRSFFVFCVDNLPAVSMNTMITDLKLMTVLDLEDSPMDSLPEGVGNLFHLHYLSVKNTKVKTIPKSIGKLINLETLDLQGTFVKELPVEIRNLKKLRYLSVAYVDHRDDRFIILSSEIHKGFGSLTDLQSLCFVQADSQVLEELRKLRRLRALGISLKNIGNGKVLCALIADLENLEYLSISSENREEYLDIQSMASPPRSLQCLWLTGNIKKLPDWMFELTNLQRIDLDLTGLTDDPLSVLQVLPNLLHLGLSDTYNYEHLHFKDGHFPKLQILSLWYYKALKFVMIENGAMPCLKIFEFGYSPLLREVPTGLEHLKNLKLLEYFGMLRQAYGMIKAENWDKLTKHIPEIRVSVKFQRNKYDHYSSNYLSSLSPEDFEQFIERIGPK